MSGFEAVGSFAEKNFCVCEYGAPMCEHTTFKTGGPAALMISPENEVALSAVLKKCTELGIVPVIIGNGSNVLAHDDGIDSVVIKISGNMSQIRLTDETTVECGAGLSLSRLCRFALEKGLSGLEFAFGIPGSVGGAVFMNAGAYGGELSDVLCSADFVDFGGNRGTLSKDEMELGYRTTVFKKGGKVVTAARFALKKGDKEEIRAKMEDFLSRRKEKQPLEYPSAGSTFKRPEGNFAGALIEQCSLKGYTIGGAQVSEKHAGFVINKGSATTADIKKLMEYITERVKAETGITLEPEVIELP